MRRLGTMDTADTSLPQHPTHVRKPRAGPRRRPERRARIRGMSGRPLTVLALFGLGLLFAAWMQLHALSEASRTGHTVLLGMVLLPWIVRPRLYLRVGGALGVLGSSCLLVGGLIGGFVAPGAGGGAVLVVELVIEAAGAVLLGILFHRRVALVRLRDGLEGGDLLRVAYDSVSEPVVLVDEGCRVVEVNWLAEALFGRRLMGELACETPYFQRDDCSECPVGQCFDMRRPRFFVQRDAEGRAAFEVSTFPLMQDGVLLGRQIQRIVDVSTRSVSERQLRFLRHVIDAVQDAVFGLDLDGIITTANPEAERLCGAGLYGRPILDVLRFADREDLERLAGLLGSREAGSFEIEVYAQDDESLSSARTIVGSLYPVLDDEGNRIGLGVVLRDVTDRHRAEEQLRQSEKMSLLGNFVTGLAHELNNPLGVIYGDAEALVEQSAREPAPIVESARRIFSAAERCRRMVTGLLRFAHKGGTGHAVVDLNQVVLDALDLIGKSLAKQDVTVRFEPAGEPVRVRGDGVLLGQVVLNLLTNAAHAIRRTGRPGEVSVRTSRAGDDCMLEVSDDGPGIDATAMAHLFEPFFTTKAAGEGTGLGLSVSLGIVQDHGGRFEVRNRPPRGATFAILLPALAPGERQEPEAEPSGAPLRVMIVDDEEGIRAILSGLLRRLGHRVETADGGRAAREVLLASQPFDAVVCDVLMPDLSGPALYRELVAARASYRGRFIFVTGDVMSDADAALDLASGNRVLQKPFRAEAVQRALNALAPVQHGDVGSP